MEKIRLGMIGTGRIAHRFMEEAGFVASIVIAGIYNPHIDSVRRFAEECGVKEGCCLTDDLTQLWDAVDAVYIATPHESHYIYARQALLQKKHVLCEKPMAFLGEQAAELFALAKEQGCILMEAVKTAYCPGFKGLLEVIKSGAIGTVYDVEACFSRISATNVREVWDREYGGSFTEFGTYPLLPVVKILGWQSQESYIWTSQAATGVDSYAKMCVAYEEATATVKTGLGIKSEGQLVIAGSKGYILVPSPWWLTKAFEVRHEDPHQIERYTFAYEGGGLRYELAAFIEKISILNQLLLNNPSNEKISAIARNRAAWDAVMYETDGIVPEESIWMAYQMEMFRKQIQVNTFKQKEENAQVRIWGHRGCSMQFPENTLEAFEAAAKIPGITGIELDIQLTKDGEMVVIHDEYVDRTTNGRGAVKDFSLEEIKQLCITGSGQSAVYHSAKNGEVSHIPTLREVFEVLQPYCRNNGLMINIELKNSNVRYEGMEEKVLALVQQYGLEQSIIYSSFYPESMGLLRQLQPNVSTGILGSNIHQCFADMQRMHADAVHTWNGGMDMNPKEIRKFADIPVRVWNGEEPLYGQDRPLKEFHMTKYALLGATDIFTNIPEKYLSTGDV